MEKKTVIIEVQTEDGVKQLDRLSAKFDEVYGDVLPLTASIGELEDQLYQMALEGKKGTEEFNLLAQEAGRLKKTLQQVDMEVDGLSMTTANKLGGALGGVTAGFELVQGAMGAMGAESEKVQEALLKVQSAMAIAQGVQGIRESIPVFKSMAASISQTAVGQKLLNVAQIAGAAAMRVLNLVMAANPIGLVVTAVAALSGAFYALTQRVDKAAIAQKEFQRQIKLTARLSKESQDNLINQAEISNRKTQQAIDIMKAKGATDAEVYNAEREFINQKLRQMDVQRMSGTKLTKEQYKEYTQLIADRKILDAEYSNTLDQKRKENAEKAKADREKQLDEQQESNNKSLELYKERLEIERQMQADELEWKASEDQKIIDTQKLKDEQQREDDEMLSEFRIKLWEREAAESKRLEDEKLANRKQAIKTSIDLTQQSLSVIGDLVDSFAGKDEASQKRAFKVKKIAAIASATIDTYKGASSAYAETPGGVVLKTIAASIALASGLAKVKAISATQFEGGAASASSGGSGAPSLPQSNPAQFNIVGNSGTNQLNGLGGGVTQAYVVSGDVTTAQSLERNKITTATL